MRRGLVAVMAVMVAACGAGGTDEGADDTAVETTAATRPADDTTTTAATEETTTTAASGAPAGGSGEATLTVGDEVYEFDNYYCVVGSDNTGNDNISFSSGAFGEVDGNRAQLDASIYDGSADDRMEGDGVIASVTFYDVTDFSNPKVAWVAESGMQPTPVVFEFDGATLRVETTFDDARTDELEEIPGVLEATCGE
jgi:hypothetical protein